MLKRNGQMKRFNNQIKEDRKSFKIFVGGLTLSTTDESLNTYFSRFGQASRVVMIDKTTGNNRGFGFVDFDCEQAKRRVLKQQTHIIHGKTVACAHYEEKKKHMDPPWRHVLQPKEIPLICPFFGATGDCHFQDECRWLHVDIQQVSDLEELLGRKLKSINEFCGLHSLDSRAEKAL